MIRVDEIRALIEAISVRPYEATRHVVLIFDECHRSQFGEMHQKITKFFKKYYLFGFTGTPIFPAKVSVITCLL